MPERPPITPSSTVSRAPEQVSTEIADEIVLLGLRSSKYFGLDGVGADVWKFLAEPRRFDDIVDEVAREYEVDGETARQDLSTFLRELEEEGLVEIQAASE